MDSSGPARNLRKSSRLHDNRAAPTSSPVERAKHEDLPSPRTTRKRISSVIEPLQNGDHSDDSSPVEAPLSATSTRSGEFPGHVCLCQPEPRIPRPRNAFILYRQHHQQSINSRNPGLHNPDISKIIGEQWKSESDEEKKVWQDLALEEKQRHQEQYPDYRYQPRRAAKPGSSPLNPSGQHTTVDKYRCPRCGGRSIKTPTSPFLDSSFTPTLPPPNLSEGHTPTTQYLPIMSNLSLESPVRRRAPGPSHLSHTPVSAISREETSMYSPLTPNKKRRFEYGPPPASNGRRVEGPHYPQYSRRQSIPNPLPPIQVRNSPPNSAGTVLPRTPRDARRASLVELGPVPRDPSLRTVEELLNAFPYPNKIKLLARITPPYKDPSSASSTVKDNRGAIIAVEGDELAPVQELSKWLCEYLVKQEEFSPRIDESPRLPKNDGKEVTFQDYLNLIGEWHSRSAKMIKEITAPSTPSRQATSSKKGKDKEDDVNMDAATPPGSPTDAVMKPVIILPTFQLHASTAYASSIPIRDSYNATDHWQWMATLWRGIVGPDLTIYVKTYDAKEGLASTKPDMDEGGRCLTVFKEKERKFADADLRRVGFEVNEWIKGMGSVRV